MTQKGRALLPTPKIAACSKALAFDDVDDLMRLRAHDDVAAVDQDHLIAAPLRIDLDDPGRKRVEVDRTRDPRANRDVEVDVGGFLDARLRLDGGDDLGALFGRRGCGRRGGGVARWSVPATWLSAAPLVWAVPVLLSAAPLLSVALLDPCRSCCRGPRPSCPCRPWCSVSELMLFDFSPAGDLVSCALLPDGIFSLDSAPFAPFMSEAPPGSRCIVPDRLRPETARSAGSRRQPDGRLRGHAGALRIRKAGAGDQCRDCGRNQKTISHKFLLTWMHCPHRQRKEMCDVPDYSRFHQICLMNA